MHRQCEKEACQCLAIKITRIQRHLFDLNAAKAHEIITDRMKHSQGAAHFNLLLGYFLDSHPSSSKVVLATEYEVNFFPTCKTLNDALVKHKIGAWEWKVINFQFISALLLAQERIRGFCHNDTHLQNLLLVPNTKHHVCRVKSGALKLSSESPFLVRLIDFDLVTFHGGGSQAGKMFFKYTPENSMHDFFRFVSSANQLFYLKYPNKLPKYIKEWRKFVVKYLPPSLIYESSLRETEKMIDPNGGILTRQGGNVLQDLYGPQHPSGLHLLLHDSYFEEFKV